MRTTQLPQQERCLHLDPGAWTTGRHRRRPAPPPPTTPPASAAGHRIVLLDRSAATGTEKRQPQRRQKEQQLRVYSLRLHLPGTWLPLCLPTCSRRWVKLSTDTDSSPSISFATTTSAMMTMVIILENTCSQPLGNSAVRNASPPHVPYVQNQIAPSP